MNDLIRVAVYYDGNYFFHVSNYYQYHHARNSRISVSGLHRFIREEVAKREDFSSSRCRVVEGHYFRGRLRANDTDDGGLFRERTFDDVLSRERITTHYLPLAPGGEKGIDVWLALEAFEGAVQKRYDVLALIASDGDFQPLVRKVNATGARVMVLGWDFRFKDRDGNERETKTAQSLKDEASYVIPMAEKIDNAHENDVYVNGLFVARRDVIPATPTTAIAQVQK